MGNGLYSLANIPFTSVMNTCTAFILVVLCRLVSFVKSQSCSCSDGGPEFAVTFLSSSVQNVTEEEHRPVFEGPMCADYSITDVSADNSCGTQNSLDFIILPTTSDCLNDAIWSLRDVSNDDYVSGFNPLFGSGRFYDTPLHLNNPTNTSGLRIPMTVGVNGSVPTSVISICTKKNVSMFDETDDASLRTMAFVLADDSFVECTNSTMIDICSGSVPSDNNVTLPLAPLIPKPERVDNTTTNTTQKGIVNANSTVNTTEKERLTTVPPETTGVIVVNEAAVDDTDGNEGVTTTTSTPQTTRRSGGKPAGAESVLPESEPEQAVTTLAPEAPEGAEPDIHLVDSDEDLELASSVAAIARCLVTFLVLAHIYFT